MESMRILVTGATGFIGRALLAVLAERGDEAVVVSRRAREPAVGWDALETEVARADAVVHLAGEPIADARWTPERLERIRASRVETTRRIADAISRATVKPRVFVSGSAVGIYGMRIDGEVLDEDSPAGDDVLARIVVEWERAADAARSAGVRVVHPRIGIVLGREGGALLKMAAPFRWFVGGPIGSGAQWVSWVHVRDVVRALILAMDSDALEGPVNVVSPEPVTMGDLARTLGHALHRPSFFRVPPFALRLVLGEGLAQVLLTGQRAAPHKLLGAGFKFDFPRLEQALADLR
jgi:uncharacterized protein (TIGR01777 family)